MTAKKTEKPRLAKAKKEQLLAYVEKARKKALDLSKDKANAVKVRKAMRQIEQRLYDIVDDYPWGV